MGRNTVRFRCHHCNHCCTEVVCLPTPKDVRRIVKHTGRHPLEFIEFLTPDEILDVDEDDPAWLHVNGHRYIMALQRDPDEGCVFLDQDTKLCSIYEARPYLCRLYPFKVEFDRDGEYKGFSLHKDVGCPRHRDGTVGTAHLYDLYEEDERWQHEYRSLVRKFNSMRKKHRKPEDFLALFMKGM